MTLTPLAFCLSLALVQPAQSPAAAAEAFFDLLIKSDFTAAAAMMNENLAPRLPEAKLREIFTALGLQFGPFKSRASGTVTPAGNGHAVKLRASYARGELEFTIGVAGGRISGLFFSVVPPPSPPPPYSIASAFTEREVTVGEGEWALPGTLSMPSGAGPFAAVVLVHGSGPNDRDETLGPNRFFRDLAHGLASRGIAVLRYDKRTKVHGAKLAAIPRFTVQHEAVDDAALAVALLGRTPGIASDRIFVAGHSLGAMLVPRIAAAAPSARGFIVMAGPARPLEQAIVEQIEYMAGLDGTITPAEQTRIDEARRDAEAVRALTPADADVREAIGGVPRSYWLDLRGYDPPEAAKAVTRPMLVLQGERDYQVTMKEFERWKQTLDGRSNVSFESYPSLNHMFMAGTGPGTPLEYNLPRHAHEEVIADIAAWIQRIDR